MEDLSLHILDVAENGITAGASLIEITVEEDLTHDRLVVIVEDNGRGMDPELLERVLDPFTTTRTTREVGLGLSLFRQSAQEAQGDLVVESRPGLGAKVMAHMRHSHIDRKPMGDMAETMVTLIAGNPELDFVYKHKIGGRQIVLDTREIRPELEEIPLSNPHVISLIRESLRAELKEAANGPRE